MTFLEEVDHQCKIMKMIKCRIETLKTRKGKDSMGMLKSMEEQLLRAETRLKKYEEELLA